MQRDFHYVIAKAIIIKLYGNACNLAMTNSDHWFALKPKCKHMLHQLQAVSHSNFQWLVTTSKDVSNFVSKPRIRHPYSRFSFVNFFNFVHFFKYSL